MQPTKLALELAPGNLYGWLLPPMKTLLDESIEKVPEVVHFSLYVPSTVMVTLKNIGYISNYVFTNCSRKVFQCASAAKGQIFMFVKVGNTDINIFNQITGNICTLL